MPDTDSIKEDIASPDVPENAAQTSETSVTAFRPLYGRRLEDIKQTNTGVKTWIVSFTDVMALMLTFFVLLFSMAEPVKHDWSNVSSALKQEFNKYYGAEMNRGSQDADPINQVAYRDALNLTYLAGVIRQAKTENELLSDVTVELKNGVIILGISGLSVFDEGQPVFSENGKEKVSALGRILSRVSNEIEIVGHVAQKTSSQDEALSPASLSIIRAATLAAALKESGYQKPVKVIGAGNARFLSLKSLEDTALKQQKTDQIEIIILDHDGKHTKPLLNPSYQ